MKSGQGADVGVREYASRRLDGAGRVRRASRVASMALSCVAVGLLAACGAGSDESEAESSARSATASACTSAPAMFTGSVSQALNENCSSCHTPGRVAGGTRLVLSAGASDLENYNALRDYAQASPDLLLSKSIGMPSHAGGKPYLDAESPQYKELAQLIPQMAQQVCATNTASGPGPGTSGAASAGTGAYWAGVALADDTTVLAKAAVLFAGRNPSTDEASAVRTGGPAALRQTVRGYMQGPVFERFVHDVGDTHFLTPGVVVRGNNMGLNAADWSTAGAVLGAANVTQVEGAVRNRFDASARREPLELLKHIVRNDKPYTDMVAGNYTVVNGLLAEYLGAQVQGDFTNRADDNEWRPATLPSQRLGGTREHAGVLSTHAWLQRFPTTDTNRNRHRVAKLYTQFLATDVSALAARPLDDGVKFAVPTVENPACAACHDTIDPAAAGFQNWNERNRYLPNNTNGVDHALPNTYRSNNYPKDKENKAYYQPGDNWFRDGKAPGFGATPMPGGFTGNPTALQWLGQQVAGDTRFAMGAVHFWYEGLFGRAPLKAPFDPAGAQFSSQLAAYNAQNEVFRSMAAAFATDRGNGVYNVRDLLVDLVMSPWFRAERVSALAANRAAELHDVGMANMLPPGQLNQKMIGVLGQGWNEFDNPYTGWGLSYGDFDGVQRTTRAKSHTMMQSIAVDRLVAVRSCTFTKGDFDKPAGDRLLFPGVSLADTPESAGGREAIVNTIRHLHKALWKDEAPATDTEVQRTLKLFTDVWGDRTAAPTRPVSCAFNNNNDPNYTGRSWAAVIAYMVGDAQFLFE